MLVERAAAALLGPDVAVDRLMADREQLVATEPPRNLFGTPIFPQQLLDLRPFDRGELSIASGTRAPAPRVPIREQRAIGPIARGPIALHLPRHGAAMAPEH